jgi:predicted nucleotidyltransferase
MCKGTEEVESFGIDERKLFDDDVFENLAYEFSEK